MNCSFYSADRATYLTIVVTVLTMSTSIVAFALSARIHLLDGDTQTVRLRASQKQEFLGENAAAAFPGYREVRQFEPRKQG
jgi:hypothetical protein